MLFAFLQSGNEAAASRYNRSEARRVINKTAYVIEQAYDVAHFYDFWSSNNLSRAVYYNDYAYRLYKHRSYRAAIRYSLKARQYALGVLDNCDDYWEFFYFTYYGWSFSFGYNPNFAYSAGYRDGFYDGYYAAYCDRHSHDYRHDPHYRPNGNYHNHPSHGGKPTLSSSSTIERGNTGTVTRGGSNGGGTTITRPGYVPSSEGKNAHYKNLDLGEYFTDEERKMLNDVPDDAVLERDFRKDNPSVSFNDRALSTNKAVLSRNQESAREYSNSSEKQNLTRMSVEKPTKITPSKDAQKPSTATKPVLTKPEGRNTDSKTATLTRPSKMENDNVEKRQVTGEKPQRGGSNHDVNTTKSTSVTHRKETTTPQRTTTTPSKTTPSRSTTSKSRDKSSSKVSRSEKKDNEKSVSRSKGSSSGSKSSSNGKIQRR